MSEQARFPSPNGVENGNSKEVSQVVQSFGKRNHHQLGAIRPTDACMLFLPSFPSVDDVSVSTLQFRTPS